jgi:RimJ/RimL family protein N-acetyltransferase
MQKAFIGKSYIFPRTLTRDMYLDAVRLDDERHQKLLQRYEHWKSVADKTVYGIIVEDRIVASCGWVRENDKSAEAWVITEPAFRGHGYARQVTTAWAHHLQQRGKVPFYSHAQHNLASQGVVRSLGLALFLAAVAYS